MRLKPDRDRYATGYRLLDFVATPWFRWRAHRAERKLEKTLNDPAVRYAISQRVRGLEVALDEAQLRSIEARNLGIDMDAVRRQRRGQS